MSFFKKLFSKQPPATESGYDYPGEYADRFDGVEPQAAQGSDSSAPDGGPEAVAKFAISGEEIASFSELQGIRTEVEVVDYVESSDESSLDAAAGLGSFAKVGGLDVDMDVPGQGEAVAGPDLTGEADPAEAPDDNSSTWIRVGQLHTGGGMVQNDDPAPEELTDAQQESHGGEGGNNEFVHRLPGPDPAPDDSEPTNADQAVGTLRSIDGLPVEQEIVEYEDDDDEHGSTLLRLTSDSAPPDPDDVMEADPGDENELEDLIDLL